MPSRTVHTTGSRRYLLTPFAILAGTMLLVGCSSASTPSASSAAPKATTAPAASSSSAGSSSASSAAASPVAVQSSPAVAGGGSSAATAASPAAQASPVAVSASPAATKANANTASVAELQAALDANGVPNAARWAREVDEYRPYPTDDPNLGKLRQNLAKYNPAPGVVDQIVASLTLS